MSLWRLPFRLSAPRGPGQRAKDILERRFLNVIFYIRSLRNFQIQKKISGKNVQVDYICRRQAIAIWLAVSATYNPTWADRLLLSF